ncbi:putative ATP-dependent RNA helicase DDX60 [Mixophyes fleayi]|uniref:putative ATP-dependent RNA helicase DDX60 n=1 Tax=Mixophyes fleayi TaxID=3061075 RepID=UPI003F4DC9EE
MVFQSNQLLSTVATSVASNTNTQSVPQAFSDASGSSLPGTSTSQADPAPANTDPAWSTAFLKGLNKLNQLLDSSNAPPAKRRRLREVNPLVVLSDSEEESEEVGEIYSDADHSHSSEQEVYPRNQFVNDLVLAVRQALDFPEPEEVSPRDRNLFNKAKRKTNRFPPSVELREIAEGVWKQPEKRFFIPKRFTSLYPLQEEEATRWESIPKVDIPIARLAKHTLLPASGSASLPDANDRKGVQVVPYLDDLLVKASSKGCLRYHLSLTQAVLEGHGWLINSKKSQLILCQRMVFLGLIMDTRSFASLLNDYVVSEFFVIDGDSLLITSSTNCSLKQGQDLHFFFLVERFLLNLTSKGAKYVIVFFKDMEHMYSQYPHLKCLRTQLALHLQHNTNTVVHTFSNFLSEKWRNFLREQPPYFLMVSDTGISHKQTLFFEMLMLNALGSQIDVVLTAGQESDNLRVYGYHAKSSGRHKRYITKNAKQFKRALEELTTSQNQNKQKGIKQDSKSGAQILEKPSWKKTMLESITLLSTCLNEQPDIRAIACVVSCSMTLKAYANMKNSENVQDDDKLLTLEEASDLCKMQCLCVTLMMILPLSQRARSRRINAKWNENALPFMRMSQQYKHTTLGQMRDHVKKTEINWTYVSDLNDNLLLKNIAYYFEKEDHADFKLEFGNEIDKMYNCLWETTIKLFAQGENLPSYPLRTTSKHFLSEESTVNVEQEEILHVGLMPIRCDVIEDYAGDTIKELTVLHSDYPVITSLGRTKSYDELKHWHSGKPLSDDYDRTKHEHNDSVKDKFALKSYQKLQASQYRYRQALGIKTWKKIVLDTDKPEEKNVIYKASGKKKEPQMKKKDQIIEDNLKKNKAKKENKEHEQWKVLAPSLEKEIRGNFFCGIKRIETFIKSLQTPDVKYQAQLRALTIYVDIWLEECKAKSKDQRDINIVVEIIKTIQGIMSNHQDMLQKEDQQQIATYLDKLGFENLACSLMSRELPSTNNENKDSRYAVQVGSVRFQMQYMGPHLLRDERTDPDTRVQHFIPDTWQRELLDVVDNNESAVIVAPTSSGKTYASYYCMEKVLKQSNEAIVVYVAPTKALVNQVVATVINQFNKDLPTGMALCGVFTRDYRTDALNSQVLVTVPQCLEILLLCPHRQDWVKRIKYIIFDEVHCLGGEIGAEVWEHILAMIRCPFLALSATISNPEHLTEWLKSVRQYWQQNDEQETKHVSKLPVNGARKKPIKTEKKSYKVRLVLYDKRYNDLETYICSVQNSNINFEHFHPCAAFTIPHMKQYGIPQDLSLSPRECVQLYDSMVTAWPTWPNVKTLDPEENVHLKDKIIIRKNDAIKYGEALKTEFLEWVRKGHDEKVSTVLEILKTYEPSDEEDCYKYFPLIVEKLGKLNKLPALFFLFDINTVENLAIKLADHLMKKWESRQTDSDEKEIQKLQVKADKLEKSLNSSQSMQSLSRTSSKNESLVIKKSNYESLKQKIKKLTEIPPDCTYADDKAVDKETLEKIHWHSRYSSCAEELISLSEKGIGYHHGAVDAKGRRLVEMLFSMGYIKIVTATSSLALGINMPCKSVVFLKDSVFFDALNYRQMSGRAGRRGQDLLGSVYFFNIPMPKVKKLMKSSVPQLRGQFPLSISFILRLMLLAAKADDKEDARAKVLSALKHSLMSFKQPRETQMLKLYCLFTLQFLLHEGYLDQDCNPTAFTGLVTHLHYHEPSNLVFVSFLEKGLFHQLCKPSSKDPTKFSKSVMENLVLILANLFGRYFLPPSTHKAKFHESKVFLGKLPDDFAAAVEEYNSKVATVFGNFILTASKLADIEKEYQLPLSNINFSGKEYMDSGLVDHLMSCTEGRSAISPFACLSGNTNHNLMTVRNVSNLMLQTAHIPDKHIPLLHLEKTDACGRKMSLNSYALDFFKHRSIKAIERDNGFNAGDAYKILRDFNLTIASISVSMKEMCEDENDPVALAFEQLQTLYRNKIR